MLWRIVVWILVTACLVIAVLAPAWLHDISNALFGVAAGDEDTSLLMWTRLSLVAVALALIVLARGAWFDVTVGVVVVLIGFAVKNSVASARNAVKNPVATPEPPRNQEDGAFRVELDKAKVEVPHVALGADSDARLVALVPERDLQDVQTRSVANVYRVKLRTAVAAGEVTEDVLVDFRPSGDAEAGAFVNAVNSASTFALIPPGS